MKKLMGSASIAMLALCWFVWRGHWFLAALDASLVVFFGMAALFEFQKSSSR